LGLILEESTPDEIIKLAHDGDAEAQFNLGLMYEMGMGVGKDAEESYEWYRKSANQNHAKSQYNVGVYLAIGKGVKKNVEEAKEWILKANRNGYSGGIF
jgi:hypothetical protein